MRDTLGEHSVSASGEDYTRTNPVFLQTVSTVIFGAIRQRVAVEDGYGLGEPL